MLNMEYLYICTYTCKRLPVMPRVGTYHLPILERSHGFSLQHKYKANN